MTISLKRVYAPSAATDGCRILVDRLWPRGLSRRDARIDLWVREAAPSHELRRWYGHEADKWPEFKNRYHKELSERSRGVVGLILEQVSCGPVTFVFASREVGLNNAAALKEYIESVPGAGWIGLELGYPIP